MEWWGNCALVQQPGFEFPSTDILQSILDVVDYWGGDAEVGMGRDTNFSAIRLAVGKKLRVHGGIFAFNLDLVSS